MLIVALSLLFLSILTLAGCQVKQLQSQDNTEYPAMPGTAWKKTTPELRDS
jgi:hypothetical protein